MDLLAIVGEYGSMSLLETLRTEPTSLVLGVHDSLSARLAQESPCEALWVSSLGLSLTHGLPDNEVITMTEALAASFAIARSTRLPIMVDCDTGFGPQDVVSRMAYEASILGIDGLCIQDQGHPKRNSFESVQHSIANIREFTQKISAAAAARSDTQRTAIIARTEAIAQGLTVRQTLERAYAYVDAGADAVLLQSVDGNLGMIRDFTDRWRKKEPIGVIATAFVETSILDFASAGVNFAIYANQALRAAFTAMARAYAQINKGNGRLPLDIDMATMDELLRLPTLP